MKTYELGVRLLKACTDGDQAEMAALLRQGADPNFRTPDSEKNPLNPNWRGSQHPVFYLENAHRRNPGCDRDAMVNLLVEYGAVIPQHLRYSYMSSGFRAAIHHLVRQGMPVDYREYHWAKQRGFDEIIEPLEERGVYSDCPVYDVDAMLAASPACIVLDKLYRLCGGYSAEKPPQLNHHERVLCDAWQCASEACKGLDCALDNYNFPEIYSGRAALAEIKAMRACAIVDELRSFCQSLGANADLECAELYCLFTGNDEEQDEKLEKMSKFAASLSSAFLDDVNQAMEAWFLLNLDSFRVRCPE